MSDEAVYHHAPKVDEVNETTTTSVEQSDRGLFDFMSSKKKEEEENKCEDAAISSEFDQKVQVSEPPVEPKADEEKHETLFQKMQTNSGSSSDSSSDEEGEDGVKKEKKKKKSLTTQIKEKIEERKEKHDEEEEKKHEDDTYVPVEKYEEVAAPPHISEVAHPIPTPEQPYISEVAHPIATPEPEEKKGFMEKLKEKLPGGHKKVEEEHAAPPPSTPLVEPHDEDKEKKGIFEKIKEKIPGYHSKTDEEKEKVKECD